MITNNLLSAYGWFAALLVIMILITLLFGFIVVIALRPIKREPRGANASVRKLLARRESELTVELMNNKGADSATKEELLTKLRRIKSAEEVVDELVKEEKAVAAEVDAEDAKRAKKPPKTRPAGQKPKGAKPPKVANGERDNFRPTAAAVNPAAQPAAPASQPASAPEAQPAAADNKPESGNGTN